jgi:hypothetical protein
MENSVLSDHMSKLLDTYALSNFQCFYLLQGNIDEEESFILRDRLLPLIICLLRTVSSIIVLYSTYVFVAKARGHLQMSPCLTCLFI